MAEMAGGHAARWARVVTLVVLAAGCAQSVVPGEVRRCNFAGDCPSGRCRIPTAPAVQLRPSPPADACLPEPLPRLDSRTVPCDVFAAIDPTFRNGCDGLEGYDASPPIPWDGGTSLCRIQQVVTRVTDTGVRTNGVGWFYDDFGAGCDQRITFTADIREGVPLHVDCFAYCD